MGKGGDEEPPKKSLEEVLGRIFLEGYFQVVLGGIFWRDIFGGIFSGVFLRDGDDL